MGKYSYNSNEEKLLKVMKMNQDDSLEILNNEERKICAKKADEAISSSFQLLEAMGYNLDELGIGKVQDNNSVKVVVRDFESLANEADSKYGDVEIENLLSDTEMQKAYNDLDRINTEFSKKTSIKNKIDLNLLGVAIALQMTKALVTPQIASKFKYGESFNKDGRMAHNDPKIESEHKQANDEFRDRNLERHKPGYWINLLYQTPAYDITKGSPDIHVNMEGKYHRLHTLGHDPILGWVFGTANILTDIITLNNLSSFRVARKPVMKITQERVTTVEMLKECYDMVEADFLNLPAALFAQWQHLKSDKYTKTGLPVPLLEVFSPELAGKLYKSQYDELCLERDMKIIGVSAMISSLFNMVIGLIHGMFFNPEKDGNRNLYEVRTRKILLISNTIASSSSILYTTITKNPKNLDLGGLLVMIGRLFSDVRFMARIKQEYIDTEINKQILEELKIIDDMLWEYA